MRKTACVLCLSLNASLDRISSDKTNLCGSRCYPREHGNKSVPNFDNNIVASHPRAPPTPYSIKSILFISCNKSCKVLDVSIDSSAEPFRIHG